MLTFCTSLLFFMGEIPFTLCFLLLVHGVSEFNAAVQFPHQDNRKANQKISRTQCTGQTTYHTYNKHSYIHETHSSLSCACIPGTR